MKRILTVLLAVFLPVAGCRKAPRVRDGAPHPRIVTHSPALTQSVFDMGLGDHVVGVTKFCRLPDGEQRVVVGDRLASAEVILNVRPDVVLIQQNPDDFIGLRNADPDVAIEHFTIDRLDDIAAAIERIGRIVGDEELGRRHRKRFERSLESIREHAAGRNRPRVMFVFGCDRPQTHGRGTFIGDMIVLAGGVNAAAEKYDRWAFVSNEGIIALAPDVLICQVLQPGEADAAREHWRQLASLPAVRAGRVHVVTDSRWTIPSTLSASFAAKLADMIHPASAGEGGRP